MQIIQYHATPVKGRERLQEIVVPLQLGKSRVTFQLYIIKLYVGVGVGDIQNIGVGVGHSMYRLRSPGLWHDDRVARCRNHLICECNA